MRGFLAAVIAAMLLTAGCSGKRTERPAELEQGSLAAPQSASEQSGSSLPESAAAPSESSAAAPENSLPQPPDPPSGAAAQSRPTAGGELVFSADTTAPKQGGLIILQVSGLADGALPTAVTDLNYTPVFFRTGVDAATALMPIRSGTAAGDYTITVTAGGEQHAYAVTVNDANFHVEYIEMDAGVADSTLNNAAAANAFEELYQRMKNAEDAVYWTGDFALPLRQETQKVSSDFGDTRYVNNALSGRHSGVDFPAPLGTPVTATNAGRVAFAGMMQQTGNTVCIEHGMGLKSWYFHMDSLSCATGDQVEKGEEIGKVGTTGASTGYHLHFSFSVGGVYVNPWLILDGGVTIPADSE